MNEQTQSSPADQLRAGLSDLGYEVSAKPEAKAVSSNETSRGASPQGNQTSNNAEASTNNDVEAQTNNNETDASVSDSSVNGESTDSQTVTNQDKTKKRSGSPRIQELANSNRALKEEMEALKAQLAKGQQPAQAATQQVTDKPKEHVPKPTPPKYDRAELQRVATQLVSKIRAGQATEHEMSVYDAAVAELDNWRQYDVDERLWKIENGQASERVQGQKAWYQQQAAEKYPALKDPNSEHFKVYQSTRKRLDEIAKNLDVEGDYWAAMVSDLVLGKKKYDSETGALKQEIEKLRKELNSTKGKLEPVEESEEGATAEPAGAKPNETPIQAFRRKAKDFRKANPLAFT